MLPLHGNAGGLYILTPCKGFPALGSEGAHRGRGAPSPGRDHRGSLGKLPAGNVPSPAPLGPHNLQHTQTVFCPVCFSSCFFCFLMGLGLIHSQEKLVGWLLWGLRLQGEPDSISGTQGRCVCGAVRVFPVRKEAITSPHPCIPHTFTSPRCPA